MNKELIKKWSKKVGIIAIYVVIILFTLCCIYYQHKDRIDKILYPNGYITSYSSYRGKYKTINCKIVALSLPEDVKVYSKYFDGVRYQFYAQGENIFVISVIPFIQNPQEACNYMRGSSDFHLTDPIYKSFIDGNIKGIYAERHDLEYHFTDGESFCFNKDGFTFFVLSYGTRESYYSIFNVIKNIKVLTKPLSEADKGYITSNLLSKYQDKCLDFINTEIQNDITLQRDFMCTKVEIQRTKKNIEIICTLKGNYSQLYPGQKSHLDRILYNALTIKPYYDNFNLLGYKVTINFYNTLKKRSILD